MSSTPLLGVEMKALGRRPSASDLWGGLAGAVVILPQAMAFGVALWAPYGRGAGSGAWAGLLGAAALSLASGLAGGTVGMISAPTGPTLVLLSGALAALARAGTPGELLLPSLAAVIALAGLLQMFLGAANGGILVKFIPYPVVAGFMTGSAILMVMSQIGPLRGDGAPEAWEPLWWIPAITALATMAAISGVPRIWPRVPGMLAGLAVGTGVFYVLVAFLPGVPAGWVIGKLPDTARLELAFRGSDLLALPWRVIAPSALALAVLASLDSLLTSVVADVHTGARHDARRELVGQGLGQVLAASLGGLAGAGTTGATMVSIESGGRRWAPSICSALMIGTVLALGPVAARLPLAALAGVILHVALLGMIERDVPAWLQRHRTRIDGLTAVLVTLVTVVYDLMIAVGVGVVLAVLQFVREQVEAPVVHRRYTAAEHPSLARRPEEDRRLLEEHGDRVVVYELRGQLFFGTVERLFDELADDVDAGNWVILDMARIAGVDLTAVRVLRQIAATIAARGGSLVFATVRKGRGLGHKVRKTFRKVSPHHDKVPVETFVDADEALEEAENALLESLGRTPEDRKRKVELAEHALCRRLDPEQVAVLSRYLKTRAMQADETLFELDSEGEELYLVLRGEVDAVLRYSQHHHLRVGKFGPGTLLGEVAFLDPGPRTAEVRVVRDGEAAVLERSAFEELRRDHPELAVEILLALGREISDHFRATSAEVVRLADQ